MRDRKAAFPGTLLMAMLVISPAVSWAFQGSNTVQSLDTSIPSVSGLSNPCEEGEFLDLDVDVCAPLVKTYGFDAAAFLEQADTTPYDLTACTGQALEDLVDGLPAAGGVVNIPACTITLTGSLSLSSNVVLQGAGSGMTIIKAGPSMVDDNMIRAVRVQNVVVRDLTIDGSGLSGHGILIWYSTNALVERVEVVDTHESGIGFRHAQTVTIRYTESRGHSAFHGIYSKDCSPDDPTVPDLEECTAEAGNTAPGVLWSRDYSVYSNHLHQNAGHGLDSHASEGEIAGNSIHDNGRGTKFPDTTLLWIHHNEIFDNGDAGLHIYSTLDIPERAPARDVIYQNFFGRNADYPVRVKTPSREIYLLYNTYDGNSPNEIRVADSEIFVCPGTEDANIELAGETRREATEQQCDLSQVGSIWSDGGEPPDCLPLSLSHSGGGADPVASPTNSAGCQPGAFVAGELVGLSAAPQSGWEVQGWAGTDNDASTSSQNNVTMPASGHAVTVAYIQSLICFPLTLSHSGNGVDPLASPTNSPECSPGSFTAGAVVGLAATPQSGWKVESWIGTMDDGSQATQNTVAMPASSHAASVTYVEELFVPNRLVFQNTTLTGTHLYEACVSIKVGRKATVASGALIRLRAPKVLVDQDVTVAGDSQLTADTTRPAGCSS